ncbi:MAG: right-handed parallel beta-helix repeat-containing protein [Nocardioides sp.]|nr:right-handed parallel beta-helix repeat-containing protein [Nocardioides sp.]
MRAMSATACLAAGVATVQLVGIGRASAAAPRLYVDETMSTCSDSGDGTARAPFCTIAAAVSELEPGGTVYIGAGTYRETVGTPVSGTASARVKITAWPGRQPTVGTGMANGVLLSSRSYVTVSHLIVSGTTSAGISVSGGSNISIIGNEVTGAGQPVSGKTAPGIRLSGTSNGVVKKNDTHHNSDHGILLTGGTTGMTISDNVSSFNAEGYQRNAAGIDVVAPGNMLIGNVTHDNEDSGINFYPGGNNNLAANNVTYNNGDHGIDDLNVSGGRLIGNTVYHNCTSGINVEGTSGNYTVENNIAVDNAVYPAYHGIACSRRAGNIGIWDSAPATTTVDHNLVYLSTPGTMYVFKSSYDSLATMKGATGQEKHGVQGHPRFTHKAGGDFTLRAGSPAIDRANSGITGEQSVDAAGNPRVDDPQVPNTRAEGPRTYDDLGAFEYQNPRRR